MKNHIRKFLRTIFCSVALATGVPSIQAATPAQEETVSFFNKELFKSPHSGSLGDDEKMAGLMTRHQRSMSNALFNGLVNQTSGGNTYLDKARRVNLAVNNKIAGVDDAINYGRDYWASPAETLLRGSGDCDDFSILKYYTLRAQGVPADRLFLSSVAINGNMVDHMVLVMNVAEKGQRFVILDNRVDDMIETRNSSYGFFRALNENGFWEVSFQKSITAITVSFSENGDLYALDLRAKNDGRLKSTYDTLRREGKQGMTLISALLDLEMENITDYDLSKNGKLISLDLHADSETLKTKIKQPSNIMDF